MRGLPGRGLVSPGLRALTPWAELFAGR
jgi:hypothetical protein